MILSNRGDGIPDSTPMQWRPDMERCQYCITNQEHSQWAHEEAIEAYHVSQEQYGEGAYDYMAIQINPPVERKGADDRHSIQTGGNGRSGYSMKQVLAMI